MTSPLFDPSVPNRSGNLLAAIAEVSKLRDLPAVAEAICRSARDLASADRAILRMREGDRVRTVGDSSVKGPPTAEEHELSATASGLAIRSKEPVVIEDLSKERRVTQGVSSFHSLLALPLGRPDPTAALELLWEKPHSATVEEIGLIKSLAEVGSTSLDNARAYGELLGDQVFNRHIFELNPNVIYVFDFHKGRTIFVSRSVADSLGYTPEEMKDLGSEVLPKLMHPEDLQRIGPYFKEFEGARDEEVRTFEYRMKNKHGGWSWFLSHDTVFRREPDGRISQLIGTAVDITERKSAMDRLEKELEENKRLNRELSDRQSELSSYHSLVTHDVSNFSSALQGALDLLLKGQATPPTPDQENLLRRAYRQVFEINRLAENARIHSRIRERGLPAYQGSASLSQIVQKAAQNVRAVYFDRPFAFQGTVAEELIVKNLPFLENIFVNLIDNAVRHAAHENLRPVVRVEAREVEGFVEATVRGGSRVDDEVLKRIFDRYARGPHSTGMGLGLAVTREILERAGGSVQARNVADGIGTALETVLRIPRA